MQDEPKIDYKTHAQPAGYAVPDARRPREARAGLGQGVAADESLRGHPRRIGGPPALRPARRPAVREQRHPHRPRRQQDPEGRRRQEQDRSRASTRRTCRAGIATACRSRCRSRRRTASTFPSRRRSGFARIYANEQIVRQKADFRRLGVLGDWDHPYTTMAFKNEADEIRTLRQDPREGLHLSRPEAGQLVLRLRQRARRSGSGIRGSRRHRGRRRVPDRRRRSGQARARRSALRRAAGAVRCWR